MARLQEGVETLKDLQPDMILEGTISNVTNFGAFVDIGVHQDGLVHISALSDQFVKDPRSIVKAGDIVKVKVMEVDAERKRISLTMRLGDKAEVADKTQNSDRPAAKKSKPPHHKNEPKKTASQAQKPVEGTMAALLKQAGVKR